jgi:uncharacterized SAM-binding protein YcdF (DUF218 family)
MFYFLSKLLYYFLMPLSWVAYLILWGIWTKQPKRRQRLGIAALLTLFVWGNGYLFNLAVTSYESIHYKNKPLYPFPYDVAIVLTGGIIETTPLTTDTTVQIGPHSDRLWQAVALYKQKKVAKILLSGGEVSLSGILSSRSESVLAKKFLVEMGIPEAVIMVENQSKNTHENALNSTRLLKGIFGSKGRFLLCTSGIHLPRAQACFAKAGLITSPYATDIRSKPQRLDWDNLYPRELIVYQWQLLLREWIGYGIYWLMGYV